LGTVDGGAPAADETSPCPSRREGGIGRAVILAGPSAGQAPTLVCGRRRARAALSVPPVPALPRPAPRPQLPHTPHPPAPRRRSRPRLWSVAAAGCAPPSRPLMSDPCPAPPPGRTPRTHRTRQHRGAEALILTGATLLLGVLTLLGEWPHTSTPWLVVDVATLAASAGLMPLVSRHRVLGAGLQAVLAAVSPTGTPGSTMATIQVAWRERFTPAAALAAAGVGAHLLRWLWRPFP